MTALMPEGISYSGKLCGNPLAWREKAIEGDARVKAAEHKMAEIQTQLDECKKP